MYFGVDLWCPVLHHVDFQIVRNNDSPCALTDWKPCELRGPTSSALNCSVNLCLHINVNQFECALLFTSAQESSCGNITGLFWISLFFLLTFSLLGISHLSLTLSLSLSMSSLVSLLQYFSALHPFWFPLILLGVSVSSLICSSISRANPTVKFFSVMSARYTKQFKNVDTKALGPCTQNGLLQSGTADTDPSNLILKQVAISHNMTPPRLHLHSPGLEQIKEDTFLPWWYSTRTLLSAGFFYVGGVGWG